MSWVRLSLPLCALAAASIARAQGSPTPVEWANLQEDVHGLTQRVGELTLRVEQLEHENAQLRTQARSQPVDGVTAVQLNTAVADLNTAIHTAVAASKREILEKVGTQMEKLARQTNAALDSLAKVQQPNPPATAARSPRPAAAPLVASDADTDSRHPATAATYTVQKGDTIEQIARKTGAKFQDIITANKLTDPSRIMVGQTLLIPGGK